MSDRMLEKTKKVFEIVTDVDKIDIEKLKEALSNNAIKDWAYIIHDKDVDKDGNVVRPHYHIAVRLKYGRKLKHIAAWFGLPANLIEFGKGTYSDMLKYLIHENAPEKYQYSVKDVVANFDFEKEKDKKEGDERKEEIINGIVSGIIREYNYSNYISPIEYDKFRKSIDNAFKYRSDMLRAKFERGETGMECVFITGAPGVGKTTYAKKLCKDKGYSIFVSSSSNDILDGYAGQDAIILDDMRPSSIGLADLLKMTDNHTASSVKSRYRNKVLECKLIIVTSILPIEEWYKNVMEVQKEPIVQLKRRFSVYITMDKEKMIVRKFNKVINDYGKEYVTENPVSEMIDMDVMSDEETKEWLHNFLGMGVYDADEWKRR